ncbi:MAG: hypothetical protein IJW96_01025, partial [Clostridia bacterium]|nr:hypothetical protein [Clostridia bacterium]
IRDGVSVDWSVGLYDTAAKQAVDASVWKFADAVDTQPTPVEKQIFTIDTVTTKIDEEDSKWEENNGVYTYKLAMTDVMSKITLNNTLYLSTVEEYNVFKTALLGYEFHVHVALTPNQTANL